MTSNPIRSSWMLIASITLILSVNYNAVCCQALSPIGNMILIVEESFSSSGRSFLASSSTRSPTSAKATSLSATSSSSSSRTASPIPPPPALSVPVWSLAVTTDHDDNDDYTKNDNDDGDNNTSTIAKTKTKTKTNMNIMTYCMPVSIGPPKLWALSIFKDTKTRELFLLDHHHDDDSTPATTPKQGILQLLTKDHHALVPILGKQSGRDINKEQACAEAGWKWAPIPPPTPKSADSCQVIPSCSLYLQVQVVQSSKPILDAADHWVVLCQVVNTGEWDAERNCLRWRTMMTDDEDTTAPGAAIDGIGDNAMYSGWLRQEGHL